MKSFAELGLNEEIIAAITELGFVKPTPIQNKTIPVLLDSNKNLIALAQTGTGKTAAFGLPIIEHIDNESTITQALILCPTRELCIQITKDLASYSKYIESINITPVYGGASIDTQIRSLKKGSQIVVGTPGRVLDLINKKKLQIANISTLVLDEADEMLSMGFKEELDMILATTPQDKQVLLFSATMSKEIKAISSKYIKNPEEIVVGKQNTGCENVEHHYYLVHAKDKYETLKRISDMNPDIYGIVFCRTKIEAKEIADKLIQDGYNADALHGNLSQAQRDTVMNRFRVKHLRLLVATDVAARGLDVTDLSHIINFDLPDEIGLYVHRSGRTGRAGKSGISISIIHLKEQYKVRILEEKVGKKFIKKNVPAGKDVCIKRLFNLVDKVENVEVDETLIGPYLPSIYEKLADMEREDLIKHFISVEFNRFLEYYKDAEDVNAVITQQGKDKGKSRDKDRSRAKDQSSKDWSRDRGDGRESRDAGGSERKRHRAVNFSQFRMNIGSKKKVSPTRIIGMINDKLLSKSIEIGKIDIMEKHSFVEIDSRYENDVVAAFSNPYNNNGGIELELVNNRAEFQANPKKKEEDNLVIGGKAIFNPSEGLKPSEG